MNYSSMLLGSLLAGAVTASAAASNAADVVAFQTMVKVEVDERGQPIAIEASPKLSDGVRTFVAVGQYDGELHRPT